MNQRESVYLATMNVLSDAGVEFSNEASVTTLPNYDKHREAIISIVTASILSGDTDFSPEAKAKYDTAKKTRTYVVGLVNNWHRKDPQLNGEVKYTPKAPGSRAGCGDEQMKALKALRQARSEDAAAVKIIDAAIEKRKSELGESKKVVLTDDMIEKLPADLRAKFGL